jgi:hypothetical protein
MRLFCFKKRGCGKKAFARGVDGREHGEKTHLKI